MCPPKGGWPQSKRELILTTFIYFSFNHNGYLTGKIIKTSVTVYGSTVVAGCMLVPTGSTIRLMGRRRGAGPWGIEGRLNKGVSSLEM